MQNFSVTIILHEMRVDDLRGPKTAISTPLETLNFDFNNSCIFGRLKFPKIKNSEPQNSKMGSFSTSLSAKIGST